ncbi:ABC transporter substrate-binding protein [Kovacikia minuta CCNUW1]|uniref:ABC transporter substrate-binding protein n=1 Tax=Kovacikia minuta TaxID=2931930 RepID=UPI001CCD613A|nr:ABC transporter substrate-binding protein [Kovacikia minuta]UBF24061.1 ABC transporter substrate-binding protein [Kovacikia minuta CCNUW1]
MVTLISHVVRRSVLLLLILFGAIGLTACSLQPFKVNAAQVSQYVVTTLSDPKTFNPALSQEWPAVSIFTDDFLVDQNGITSDLEPELAEFWTLSDDKLKYIFTLREGLKWSDGQPLTAEDVAFTFNDIYLNEKIPSDVRDGLRIGEKGALPKVQKLSDRQVEFLLPEPFSPFLRTLVGTSILPAHVLRESVTTNDSKGNPQFISVWGTDTNPKKLVVNGPYFIENYTTSQRLVFRRNPHYWRRDNQGNPLPYIERIVWQIIENTDTQLLKFRSAELDALGLGPDDFSLLKREEQRGNFRIYSGGPASGTNFISFNLNRAKNSRNQPLVDPVKSGWFNTLAFRQAVAYAIDRPRMLNNTFRGIGQLQNSPVSVQSPYYLSPKEGLKVYDYNLQKAKELLLGAGFKYNSRGQLLDAEGNRIRFNLITNAENRTRVEMAAQIKQDLSKIGMQVDFTPISFGTLVEKLSVSRNWDCYLLGFTGGVEPNDGSNVWKSTGGLHSFNQGSQAGQPPLIGWQASDWEKEIDRLFIAGAREFDEQKRKEIYAKYQQIVQEQLPAIHLINPLGISAIRNFVQGVQYSSADRRGSLWNIYELKIAEN